MFTSAWFPMCMSANMHGFGMHVGVRYQYWGEGDIDGFGGVCFQEMVGSRSCDLSLSMDDFSGNS